MQWMMQMKRSSLLIGAMVVFAHGTPLLAEATDHGTYRLCWPKPGSKGGDGATELQCEAKATTISAQENLQKVPRTVMQFLKSPQELKSFAKVEYVGNQAAAGETKRLCWQTMEIPRGSSGAAPKPRLLCYVKPITMSVEPAKIPTDVKAQLRTQAELEAFGNFVLVQ